MLPSDMTSLERLIQHLEHQLVTSLTSDEDTMTSLVSDVMTSCQYKSNMALDGEAILPPLVTRQRRAECVTYRHQAVLAEARMRARRKDRLLAQVQEALDTVEDTSPRSRIFPDPSLSQLEQKPATRPNSIPAPVTSTNKPTVQIPVKPKAAWPVQQTSAQSPTVQHTKLPLELQESSSSSGDATMGITQSYMFHSSDSSEYQTTVIARDDESELKQVSRILREEKRQKEAGAGPEVEVRLLKPEVVPIPDGTLSHVPDIELETVRPSEKRLNASDRLDRLDTEKIRRPSGESAVSDPGVAPRSRGLSRALGLVKDVVGSNERLHREEQQEDISSTLSSDYHMFSTGSTDIMQYMKVPLSSMSSTSTMDNTRPSTGASERTLVEGRDGSVLHIGGAESGETSTDPPRSRQSTSRVGKHEHLKRYLQQVSSQPLNNSSGSQTSELNSTGNSRRVSDPDDMEFSVSTQDLQNVGRSRQENSRQESGRQENSRQESGRQENSRQESGRPSRQNDFGSSVTEEELMMYQSQQFDDKRRQLEKQQRLQLERLIEEQRRESDRLQHEMLDQEERLRRAQHQLYHGMGPESPQSLVPPHVQAVMKQDVLTDSDADESPRGVPFGRVLLRGSNRYHADNRYSYHEASVTQETFTSGHDSDPETPIRAVAAARRRRPVVRVPEKALDPAMKTKYDRISAAVKGYLTRRLLRTEKVRGLIKTIKDTAEFAISFHSEASIKNGIYSMQDLTLQERVIAQLRAALLEVHEIFFDISVRERMLIIDQSRELERERRYRTGGFQSLKRSASDNRGKKLSVATQRAMERKKQARLAEQTVLTLAEEMKRHRQQAREQTSTSPHASNDQQPHRLRTMDIRALRPIQGQSSPVKPTKPGMEKDAADRPHTAPAKTRATPKEDYPGSRVRKVEHTSGVKRPSSKSSSASSKTSAGNVPTTRLKSVNNQNNSSSNNNNSSTAASKLLSKPTLTTVPVSSTNRRR